MIAVAVRIDLGVEEHQPVPAVVKVLEPRPSWGHDEVLMTEITVYELPSASVTMILDQRCDRRQIPRFEVVQCSVKLSECSTEEASICGEPNVGVPGRDEQSRREQPPTDGMNQRVIDPDRRDHGLSDHSERFGHRHPGQPTAGPQFVGGAFGFVVGTVGWMLDSSLRGASPGPSSTSTRSSRASRTASWC